MCNGYSACERLLVGVQDWLFFFFFPHLCKSTLWDLNRVCVVCVWGLVHCLALADAPYCAACTSCNTCVSWFFVKVIEFLAPVRSLSILRFLGLGQPQIPEVCAWICGPPEASRGTCVKPWRPPPPFSFCLEKFTREGGAMCLCRLFYKLLTFGSFLLLC